MSSQKSSRKAPAAKRRDLEVAAALAREAVTQFHVSSALGLIELAAGRVSATRMLDIYLRLHGLAGAQGELLSYSVLAALGHRAMKSRSSGLLTEPDVEAPDPSSLIGIVKGRLRGRVHHDLRRWVELATGAVQAGMVDIHVRHAIRFSRELAETHTVAQACALYAEMAGVPAPLRDSVYIFLLDRLANEEMPRRNPDAIPAVERVALHPSRPRRAV